MINHFNVVVPTTDLEKKSGTAPLPRMKKSYFSDIPNKYIFFNYMLLFICIILYYEVVFHSFNNQIFGFHNRPFI